MDISSQQLAISKELLGLSDVEIEEVKVTRDNEIIIKVRSIKTEINCHRCGVRSLMKWIAHSD